MAVDLEDDRTGRDPTAAAQEGPARAETGPGTGPTTMLGTMGAAIGRPLMQRKIQRRMELRALQLKQAGEPAAGPPGGAPAGGIRSAGPDGRAIKAPGAAGGGAPLPPGVKQKMEGGFGQDFSNVRVHEGEGAAQLGAEAYAQGSDVHFAPGNYDPASAAGQKLIAHELTHVVQQRAGRVSTGDPTAAINNDPALEAEADAAAEAVASGQPAEVAGAGGGVQPKLSPGAAPVQGKITRGSGWGLTGWWPGGQEAWEGVIVPNFDSRFMPAVKKLDQLAVSHAPLDPDHQEAIDSFADARRYDTTPIVFADGLELAKVLVDLTTRAEALVLEIPVRHAEKLANEKSALEKLKESLTSSGEKQQVISQYHPSWDRSTGERRKALRVEVVKLITANEGKKLVPADRWTPLHDEVREIATTFNKAEKVARTKEKEKKEGDRREKERKEKLESDAQDLVAHEDTVIKSMGVAYAKTGRALLGRLRTHATLEEVEELLGLTDAGTLDVLLPLADADELKTLLGKTSAANLKKLMPAIGADEASNLEALLDHVQVGGEDALHKMLLLTTRGKADELLELVQNFAAGPVGAGEALTLLKAGKQGSQGELAKMLQHAGVGNAAHLITCLGKMEARKVEFCLDPAQGGHRIGELVADLSAGNAVWAGEAGPKPAFLKASAGDPGVMEAAAIGDVTGNAHDTMALGMPAANTGKYCSRSFGNHGGADTMRLPRRKGGTAVTYTEYDVRPFTSTAERGTKRMVIDSNGKKYSTTDHYGSFTTFA